MGGEITVESPLGQGSRFIVRLPAEVIEPKQLTAPPSEEIAPAGLRAPAGRAFEVAPSERKE